MKTTTARIAAIAVLASLGLTACGGDTGAAETQVTTPASARATSAPSPTGPTTSAPPRQSAVRASQEAAAIALVRTYVDEYNKALQSGSTTDFRQTFNETCALCLGDASRIDEYTRSNKTIAGGAFTLIGPKAIRMSSSKILVQVELRQAAARILDKNGHTLHIFGVVRGFGFTWTTKPMTGGTLMIVDSVPS